MARDKIITERELQVIRLAALQQNQIAELLNIKVTTVKSTCRNVCIKLGVKTRLQAIIKMLRLGLLQPSQLVISYQKE